MVTHGYHTYCGDRIVRYMNVESLYLDKKQILYINYN